MTTGPEHSRFSHADRIKIEQHLVTSPIPLEFVIDPREGDEKLWSNISQRVIVVPLKVKSGRFGIGLDSHGVAKLQGLQEQYGMSTHAFPAALALPKGTENFSLSMFMIEPVDLEKSPEEVVEHIAWVKETLHEEVVPHYVRSLEYLYAAKTGNWPPGVEQSLPLHTLPAGYQYSSR